MADRREPPENAGFPNWPEHVMDTLKDHAGQIRDNENAAGQRHTVVMAALSDIKTDVARVKERASIFGGLGGLISAALAYLATKLSH